MVVAVHGKKLMYSGYNLEVESVVPLNQLRGRKEERSQGWPCVGNWGVAIY